MLTKIKAKAECKLAELREERGATDPILVIAAIAVSLVLLVGGSFAVSGIITNGQNLNAKGDLDKVGVAEVANFAESDRYASYAVTPTGAESGTDIDLDTDGVQFLSDAGIGFTPTEGGSLEVIANANGWVAKSFSVNGTDYFKSSESNAIKDELSEVELPAGFTLTDLQSTTPGVGFTIANPSV